MLIHAAQRLSKLALERHRSYADFPDEIAYDDLAGDAQPRLNQLYTIHFSL
jgi:hypothetical protein